MAETAWERARARTTAPTTAASRATGHTRHGSGFPGSASAGYSSVRLRVTLPWAKAG
jgi:hypothetical protein